MENNDKQRIQRKQLGGITGRGFMPGQSGNPNGRPNARGLIAALRLKVAEIAPDGRTIEEHLIDVLLHEALRGKRRLPALELILDRLEGKAVQALQIADITKEIREKSDAELLFHLQHNRWPDEVEKQALLEKCDSPPA